MENNAPTPSQILTKYAPEIESAIRAHVEVSTTETVAPLYHMMAYHLGWRDTSFHLTSYKTGKLVRPVLCLLACEAAGGDWHSALPAAAALELTHNFSLVHDDIQDGDETRRGQPTVWKQWGIAHGINVGDGIFVIARSALNELFGGEFDSDTIRYVYAAYDQACQKLCEGQYLDLSFEQRMDVTLDEYLYMVSGKTAALLSAALEIGGRLATDDLAEVAAFRELGEELGLAFQIKDDILGTWGNEKVTGKSAGNDLRRNKKTLPVIYTLQREEQAGGGPLTDLYQQHSVTDRSVASALRSMEHLGARDYTEHKAQEHRQRAIDILTTISDKSTAYLQLNALARFLVEREF